MNQEQRRILTTISIEMGKIIFAGGVAVQFFRQEWNILALVIGVLLPILCFTLAIYLNRGE